MDTTRDTRWFCLLVGLASLPMAGYGGYSAIAWTLARSWPTVPCHVEDAWIDFVEGEGRYLFHVRYRYAFRGDDHESTGVREEYDGSWDLAESDRLLRSFPVGSWRTCQVNPRDPSRALLEHSSLAAPVGLLVAFLFIGAYLSLLFLNRTGLVNALSGPLVATLGLVTYSWGFGLPLARGIDSLRWPPCRCVVESSQVRATKISTNFGSVRSYWPDVVYRYEVKGFTRRANTVNASFAGTPWYYGPRGVVRQFPAGLETTCFVNPSDPGEAVLERSFSGTQWFGLYPLSLIALGVVGTLSTIGFVGPRVGTPRLWGTFLLGATTTIILTGFYLTSLDMIRDRRDGIAERPEIGTVIILGFLSAALLMLWIGLAYAHAAGARRGREVENNFERRRAGKPADPELK